MTVNKILYQEIKKIEQLEPENKVVTHLESTP